MEVFEEGRGGRRHGAAHEARQRLDHRHSLAQHLGGGRHFEPDETATDHRQRFGHFQHLLQAVGVIEVAQADDAFKPGAFDWERPCPAARRQRQPVVSQ